MCVCMACLTVCVHVYLLVATTHCGNALVSSRLEEGSGVEGRGGEGGLLERRTVCSTDVSVGRSGSNWCIAEILCTV